MQTTTTYNDQLLQAINDVCGEPIYSVGDLARYAYGHGTHPSDILQRATDLLNSQPTYTDMACLDCGRLTTVASDEPEENQRCLRCFQSYLRGGQ